MEVNIKVRHDIRKAYIDKSKIVSFFEKDNTTMVWLVGYFSTEIMMPYQEFKQLYENS